MARIALLLPNLAGGGAERLSLTLARECIRGGHAPEIVVMQAEGELLDEARADLAVHDLGTRRARDLIAPLVRYLKQSKPDAMVAAMWPLTVIAPIAARIAGYRGKVVVSEHAILSRQYASWGTLHWLALRASTFVGYRLAAARIGVSRGVCEDMAALSGMARGSFTVIHNPIPPADKPSADAVASVKALWGSAGPRILTVGVLKEEKNQALLLRAFAAMPRSDARLLLLGSGPEESRLRTLARELGIDERVIFAGFQRDTAPFYATADLFVLSSDHEGFGNVIVEALSYGVPVVATDCPAGPAEILDGGRFGGLVPVGEVTALAQAMDKALETPVDREALVCRAADFAPIDIARQYLAVMGL